MSTISVTRDSIRLEVVVEGNPHGPTIVLVHGWPDTHALWDRVVPLLTGEFRVVRYDNRGAGSSSVPARVRDYRLEELARDLFAVVDAVGAGEPVHLLGHDWGAVICWEAVCEPGAAGRIASYTSVSGPNLDHLGLWMRRSLRSGRFAGPLAQAVASAYTVLFQIPGVPIPVLRWVLAPNWARFVGLFDHADPSVISPAPTLGDDMVHGLMLYRANIRRRLVSPRERVTEVPVQLVFARRDRAVRPVGYEDTGHRVPNLRREQLDAGHWSPRTHPAQLARLTAEFVRQAAERDSPRQI
ncbi:alpha/beta fold hydrolase [Rhodococcus zopfii]|uniref:Alpha/beta fold hydrolase n=1 Tax=Rhodococcus zopfii TaxID=43772 RepID=A0ABU3WV24_9NOCA|nr:alpha/beta fold hydrolase [Rhodococcus zopfii]